MTKEEIIAQIAASNAKGVVAEKIRVAAKVPTLVQTKI